MIKVMFFCTINSPVYVYWKQEEEKKRQDSQHHLIHQQQGNLPQHSKGALHPSSCCGTDAFIEHGTDIEIFSKDSKLVSLRSPPKKGLYMLVSL